MQTVNPRLHIEFALMRLSYIMGKPSTYFYKQSADVNKDNVINIADIIQITNIILKK